MSRVVASCVAVAAAFYSLAFAFCEPANAFDFHFPNIDIPPVHIHVPQLKLYLPQLHINVPKPHLNIQRLQTANARTGHQDSSTTAVGARHLANRGANGPLQISPTFGTSTATTGTTSAFSR